MPQAKYPPKEMVDKLSVVVEAIGDLMEAYPVGSEIVEEFRAMRKEASAIVTGDLTDTLELGEKAVRDGYRDVKNSVSESRLARAQRRLSNEDKLAGLLSDHELLQDVLNRI